jgi:hypothetical protein
MSEKITHFPDDFWAPQGAPPKSAWGDGPWQNEPDRVEFEHKGFDCIIRRGPGGQWCGYVGLPAGHPWRDLGRDGWDVDVHGGLTYQEPCDGDPERGVCHVPKPGEPDDIFWIGFDCAHAGDYCPGMEATMNKLVPGRGDRRTSFLGKPIELAYKNIAYVRQQTEALAEQAAVVTRQ